MIFSHKEIVEATILDLNEVVGQTDKLLRRIIGEHIDFQTTIAANLWPIKADRSQMEQVIVNLAVNARDAMPTGGSLVIKTKNVILDDQTDEASVFQAAPGEYIMLAVRDTGIGMSQTIQAHIFEPFYTTKERGRGTGLGLATVYGIIQQSGGDIRVYSEVGQGTTFKIYLPRTNKPVTKPPTQQNAVTLQTGSEMILLCEDDEGVRSLVSDILHMQGYTVLEAQDGQIALQLAAKHGDSITLLLTDVVMPSISGKALAEQVTRYQPNLKVLYMSGYNKEEITHHGVPNPGAAFLQKPFNFTTLIDKVRQVLDGSA
jgi:CheY-like chemotaxis protein